MPVDATLSRPGALSYLEIAAREPARSAEFYARVLGWRVERHGGQRDLYSQVDPGWYAGRLTHEILAHVQGRNVARDGLLDGSHPAVKLLVWETRRRRLLEAPCERLAGFEAHRRRDPLGEV